jgi:hypothetical protein
LPHILTALHEYGIKLEAEGVVDDSGTLPRLLDMFVIEHAAKKKPKTLAMYSRCVGLLKPIVADFRPHPAHRFRRRRHRPRRRSEEWRDDGKLVTRDFVRGLQLCNRA